MDVVIEKKVIGSEEWVALPELGLNAIKARVDSGAKTSALHAFNVSTYCSNDIKYVKFDIHPIQDNRKISKTCCAPLAGKRQIRSSNGQMEIRYVIVTQIKLGGETWDVELTLTNRNTMGHRMIIGREAMKNRFLVDPNETFLSAKITEMESLRYYVDCVDKKTALNIILLASNPALYSNKRIMAAAEKMGHTIVFIDVSMCHISIKNGTPAIYYKGQPLNSEIDAVIPRLKPSMTFYGCALVRQFQALGAFCLNNSAAIANSRDKLKCLQILATKGIDMPSTIFANSVEHTKELIKGVGGVPVIIKLLESTQGKGVIIAETHRAASSLISAFKTTKTNVLVQEFIKEANNCDIRCFVIDGVVVASIMRKAADNEFRSNLHLGGIGLKVKLTKAEKKIAIDAANNIGLSVAGVDILRSSHGPKVIEVNSSPGLEGIEKVSKSDIASMMIACIERHIYGSIPLFRE